MSLAARVDAILAARTPAPARSLTFPISCHRCAHDRVRTPGLDIVTVDTPGGHAITRIQTRCVRCGRHWTYTVTCAATASHLIDTHEEAVA